jgi:hypothetical protein
LPGPKHMVGKDPQSTAHWLLCDEVTQLQPVNWRQLAQSLAWAQPPEVQPALSDTPASRRREARGTRFGIVTSQARPTSSAHSHPGFKR